MDYSHQESEHSNEKQNQEPADQPERVDEQNDQSRQEASEQDDSKDDSNILEESVICRICEQPIVFAAETFCGHCFCEICLIEYFLVLGDCPICKQPIRDKQYFGNKVLDNFIEGFVEKLGEEYISDYRKRKEKAKAYKQQKNLEIIQSGMEVDVRDENFVWHKGLITRTFNRQQRGTKILFFVVRYLESQKKQEFSTSSNRIAKSGFYTNRQDIPKIRKGEIIIEDIEQRNTYLLPKEGQKHQSSQQAKSC